MLLLCLELISDPWDCKLHQKTQINDRMLQFLLRIELGCFLLVLPSLTQPLSSESTEPSAHASSVTPFT